MPKITGGCLCRAIQYEIDKEPTSSATCYCRVCQYIAGGAPSHSVLFHKSDVTIQGKPTAYWMKSEEGNSVARHFCEKCGTPLFSESEARSDYISIKVGSLDDPSIFKPSLNIWVESAQPWHGTLKSHTPKSKFASISQKIRQLFLL